MVNPSPDRVLVLTVGTGDRDQLERTLIQPILKTVEQGDWAEVVLLPSRVTEDFAASLRERLSGQPFRVRIESLPEEGSENDTDRCFGHFDAVIGDLLGRGIHTDAIAADFTRGTKAMSAALVLAAVGRGVPVLRYIFGPRDRRGTVRAGHEAVGEFRTAAATGRRLLDEAGALLRHGDFAAVRQLLPDPGSATDMLRTPPALAEESAALWRRAGFLAAWDRLDYGKAVQSSAELGTEDRERVTWVRRLADRPKRADHAATARWLRTVACDLLQNGRRRIADGHFEDALVRAYRTRELLVQFLLFDRDVDTASIDPDLPELQRLQKKLCKKKSKLLERGPDGRLKAARMNAVRLLKQFDTPLGTAVLDFDQTPSGRILEGRNLSILIHGFSMKAPTDSIELSQLYDDLQRLLRNVAPETGAMLARVRGLLPAG